LRGAWGGSWINTNTNVETDSVLVVVKNYRSPYIGFRCVVDESESERALQIRQP
jgi:hypothetical protein